MKTMAKNKKAEKVKLTLTSTQMVEVGGRDIVYKPGDIIETSTDTARIWTSRGYATLVKEEK